MLGSPVDIAILCGVALLIFGPKRFPEIGKALGQGIGNFKKSLTEAQDAMSTEANKPAEKPSGEKEKEEAQVKEETKPTASG